MKKCNKKHKLPRFHCRLIADLWEKPARLQRLLELLASFYYKACTAYCYCIVNKHLCSASCSFAVEHCAALWVGIAYIPTVFTAKEYAMISWNRRVINGYITAFTSADWIFPKKHGEYLARCRVQKWNQRSFGTAATAHCGKALVHNYYCINRHKKTQCNNTHIENYRKIRHFFQLLHKSSVLKISILKVIQFK